ncbi:MAG: hypothetical protein ABI406_12510 [Ktedonobacteraceae bacterium]
MVVQLDTLYEAIQHSPEPLLGKDYYFHEIRVTCQTNHLAIMVILDSMLGMFPEPDTPRGHTNYTVLCLDQADHFPVPLPHQRRRIDTVRLLTDTRLKYYSSLDQATEFQSYAPLSSVNEAALSVIDTAHNRALTQIVAPEWYQTGFLRRYICLLALGRLMHTYGFQPCHAAAITAPGDSRHGALILGDSGSGKTTLSLGCAITGCGLLGDDLVMLREDNSGKSVNAYSISNEVSVRSNSLTLWPTLSFLQQVPADKRDKRYCTIEQLQSGATRLQTSIRLLLFPSLTTATESVVTRLSKAALLQELVDQYISKRTMSMQTQEYIFSLLGRLVEQAAGYRIAIARGSNDGPEIVRSLFVEATL